MGNEMLSGKQVGSQASRRVTRRLTWIQPVCISINAVPALKGLTHNLTHCMLGYKMAALKICLHHFEKDQFWQYILKKSIVLEANMLEPRSGP